MNKFKIALPAFLQMALAMLGGTKYLTQRIFHVPDAELQTARTQQA